MPELEIIYPICAKGCRKIRDAEFLEDIRYRMPLLKRTYTLWYKGSYNYICFHIEHPITIRCLCYSYSE